MARVSFHVTFFKKSAGSRGKDLAKQGPCGSEDVPVTAGWAEAGQVSPQQLVAFLTVPGRPLAPQP